jgi:hypothetical protein
MRPTAKLAVLTALAAASALGGCASFRQAVGAEKVAPDEFRVVTKAPLVIPPEFNLRPPRPGEARPMELRADLQARTALFGVQIGQEASEGEQLLVARAGAQNADPRIRAVVDDEGGAVVRKPRSFADRVLSFGRDGPAAAAAAPAPLPSEEEARRLEQEAIRNATGGGQVTIQQSAPRGFKLPGM